MDWLTSSAWSVHHLSHPSSSLCHTAHLGVCQHASALSTILECSFADICLVRSFTSFRSLLFWHLLSETTSPDISIENHVNSLASLLLNFSYHCLAHHILIFYLLHLSSVFPQERISWEQEVSSVLFSTISLMPVWPTHSWYSVTICWTSDCIHWCVVVLSCLYMKAPSSRTPCLWTAGKDGRTYISVTDSGLSQPRLDIWWSGQGAPGVPGPTLGSLEHQAQRVHVVFGDSCRSLLRLP